MSYEKIKEEFIKNAEAYIKAKRQPFEKLSGMELIAAKEQYLDDFQDYINHLNFQINAILDEYLISFNNLEEANTFQDFMKPTFVMLSKKYTDGLVD